MKNNQKINGFEAEYRHYLEQECGYREISSGAAAVFENSYQVLGIQKEPAVKRRSAMKISISTAAAFVACFMMLFTINYVNPVLAESIPVIGGIFKNLNSMSKSPVGTNLDTYPTDPVNELMAADGKTVYTIELLNVYSDGEYMHASLELRAPEEAAEAFSHFFTEGTVTVDGQPCESALFSGGGLARFWKTETGTYAGTLSAKLPKVYADQEKMTAAISIDKVSGIGYGGKDEPEVIELPVFSKEVEVTADTSGNKSFDTKAESGGYRLHHVDSNPSITTVTVERPGLQVGLTGLEDITPDGTLYTPDGKSLNRNYAAADLDQDRYDSETGELLNPDEPIHVSFDGVPAGTPYVVFRWVVQGLYIGEPVDRVLAEYTIDFTTQSVTATETYLDENSPHYLSNPHTFSYGEWDVLTAKGAVPDPDETPVMIDPSTAEGQELLRQQHQELLDSMDFQNGLALDGIRIKNDETERWIDITLFSQNVYREIEVQVLRGDEKIVSEVSYDGTHYTDYAVKTGFFDEQDEWFEMRNSQNHYVFRIPFTEGDFTANDPSLTIRAVDPETNEVLMETVMENIRYQ